MRPLVAGDIEGVEGDDVRDDFELVLELRDCRPKLGREHVAHRDEARCRVHGLEVSPPVLRVAELAGHERGVLGDDERPAEPPRRADRRVPVGVCRVGVYDAARSACVQPGNEEPERLLPLVGFLARRQRSLSDRLRRRQPGGADGRWRQPAAG